MNADIFRNAVLHHVASASSLNHGNRQTSEDDKKRSPNKKSGSSRDITPDSMIRQAADHSALSFRQEGFNAQRNSNGSYLGHSNDHLDSDNQSFFMQSESLNYKNLLNITNKNTDDHLNRLGVLVKGTKFSSKDLMQSATTYHKNPSLSKFKENHFDTYEQEYGKYF